MTSRSLKCWLVAFFSLAMFGTLSVTVRSDDIDTFYRGNTVRILIGYDPGTGYDVYARALTRHLGRHIPGRPQIIAQNMPGAASLTMMNYLYNVSARDGTVIGLPARNLFTEPMFGNALAKYDPARFTMVGNMSKDFALCLAWHTSNVNKFQDVIDREILVGATAPSGISAIYPHVLNGILNTKFKIVTGYTDANAISLALERGELEGYCGYTVASIKASHPDWLEKKSAKVFVLLSLSRSVEYPDVPSVMELVKDAPTRDALALIFGDLELGRPVVGPPDVPQSRVQALRSAFDATMKDSDFINDAERLKIDIDPMSGVVAEMALHRLLSAPQSAVRRVMEIRGN